MIRRPPRSTLFPYTTALPICFRSGLNNLGYVEGRDFVMEYRWTADPDRLPERSEEHTSELQSHLNLVCRLLLEKKKQKGKRRRITRANCRDPSHKHRTHQGEV